MCPWCRQAERSSYQIADRQEIPEEERVDQFWAMWEKDEWLGQLAVLMKALLCIPQMSPQRKPSEWLKKLSEKMKRVRTMAASILFHPAKAAVETVATNSLQLWELPSLLPVITTVWVRDTCRRKYCKQPFRSPPFLKECLYPDGPVAAALILVK